MVVLIHISSELNTKSIRIGKNLLRDQAVARGDVCNTKAPIDLDIYLTLFWCIFDHRLSPLCVFLN